MSRLDLNDDLLTIVTKMSEGNPGCLTFLMEALSKTNQFRFVEMVLRLDKAELYGSHIYMLWNDCCDRDLDKTIGMITDIENDDELRSYVVDRGYGKKYEQQKSPKPDLFEDKPE